MTKKITGVLVLALLVSLAVLPAGTEAKNNPNSDQNQTGKVFGLTKIFRGFFQPSSTSSDDDYDYKQDDRLPPGLRSAPGIEKRMETGKGLPYGWWQKLFGGGTTTPPVSTDGLKITALTGAAGTSTAVISWQTSQPADSKVYYSTTSPATIMSSVAVNPTLTASHAVSLTGLTPNTTYYYFVTSTKSDGQTATSGPRSLTTAPLPVIDTRAPEIVFSTVINVSSSSVRLIWVTDEAATSRAWVSATVPINTAGPATVENNALVYYHDLMVSGLTASSTYHYALGSADASGNVVILTDKSFTTSD